MIFVERGNKVCEVNDDLKDYYLGLGYNITDGEGHTIEECVPTDVNVLRTAYTKHLERIAELEAEIESLKAKKSTSSSKTTKSSKKSEED